MHNHQGFICAPWLSKCFAYKDKNAHPVSLLQIISLTSKTVIVISIHISMNSVRIELMLSIPKSLSDRKNSVNCSQVPRMEHKAYPYIPDL